MAFYVRHEYTEVARRVEWGAERTRRARANERVEETIGVVVVHYGKDV
jgi:hypothetical protein